MFGLDLIAATGLLVLAGNTVQCHIPVVPKITVTPTSAPIQYEYRLSSAQLDQMRSNTVNPYAPGTDTATGGLRHDRPKISTNVSWGTRTYPGRNLVCLWYESVDVSIALQPKIYIAKESQKTRACRDAIKEHELEHVRIDRQVINEYAQGLGQAVKKAVDNAGAMGPYNLHEQKEVQEQLVGHIQAAMDSQKFLLHQEMSRRQAKIDSLEEYEAISVICNKERR